VGVCRPNVGSGSFNLGAGSFDPVNHQVTYFTPLSSLTGPYTDPGKGKLGNVERNSLFGPRLFTDDMALFKNFGITERVKGQFRMDAYNVFNHPVYGFSSTQGNLCIDCKGDAGKITHLESDTQMRQLQFGLKFTF
jgi:hypothetical protein